VVPVVSMTSGGRGAQMFYLTWGDRAFSVATPSLWNLFKKPSKPTFSDLPSPAKALLPHVFIPCFLLRVYCLFDPTLCKASSSTLIIFWNYYHYYYYYYYYLKCSYYTIRHCKLFQNLSLITSQVGVSTQKYAG